MPQSHPTGFARHDHGQCVSSAIQSAETACKTRGVQFTPVRRRVLEILAEAHAAMGAYEVLARLDREGLGSQPPVAYRALAFLVEHGFAHRIERLNAFVACAHPGEGPGSGHSPVFLICRSCGTVAEAEAASGGPLAGQAAETGFRIEQTVVEAQGLCPDCQPVQKDAA